MEGGGWGKTTIITRYRKPPTYETYKDGGGKEREYYYKVREAKSKKRESERERKKKRCGSRRVSIVLLGVVGGDRKRERWRQAGQTDSERKTV